MFAFAPGAVTSEAEDGQMTNSTIRHAALGSDDAIRRMKSRHSEATRGDGTRMHRS